MELKKLVKNTSFLMGSSFIQFLAGIIRAKLSALYLGTLGVGVINQLMSFTTNIYQFTSLSMSEAVVKQIAENHSNEKLQDIIKSSLKGYIFLACIFMTITIAVSVVFYPTLTQVVFGSSEYYAYTFIGILCLPILLLNSIPYAILKAFKDTKSISRARIFTIIANLIVFIPLVIIYKLKGALLFVPIFYLQTFLVNYYFAHRYYLKKNEIKISDILSTHLNFGHLKEILLFSGIGLALGLFSVASDFAARAIVVSNLGVESLGLYSPILTWSGLFTGFLLPSFSVYLYPRFCETNTKTEITGILNDGIRLGTFFMIPLLFLGIPFRALLLTLFYSKDFIQAELYLPFHFLSLLFYVWFYVFTQSMTPNGKIKQHAIFMLFYYLADFISTLLFVPKFGLYGWMLKYCITPFLFFWIYFMYSKREFNFLISTSNVLLMIYICVATCILILLPYYSINGLNTTHLLGLLFCVATFFFLTESERRIMNTKVHTSIIEVKNYFIKQNTGK